MRKFFFLITIFFFLFAVNAFAAIYYVATTGDNGDPGTEAQPWATLAYAAANISDGDTIIVGGGIYTLGCTISKSSVTFQAKSGETPIVDGDGVRPGGEWDPLMLVKASGANLANNVTIDGFTVRRGTGYGIRVDGNSGGADNAIIKNCKIYETYRMGIMVIYDADNALIEDCEIYECGICMEGGYSGNQPVCTGGNRPSQISTKHCDAPTFRRCKVHDSYHEGFNIDAFTTNATVEYCEIYGNPRLQLYLVNSTDNIVRYNLIYGTSNGDGPGIWINNESRWSTPVLTTNNKIYGNLIANTDTNFWIAGATGSLVENVTVYNNTFVEATETNIRMETTTGDGHIFKNNIIWQTNNTIANVPSGKMTCDYNLWSRTPDVDVQGANDPSYATPVLTKTSGWQAGAGLTGNDFTLQNSSPAIDVGMNLGASYDDGLNPDSVWPDSVTTLDQDLYGSGWEMGAFVFDFTIYNASPVNNATGISITVDLGWTNPTGTTNIDLLFDKKSEHDPPTTVELNDQNVETWDCGTLDYSTEYVWRVDVNHSGGTETGSLYYFTTTSQANPPLPSVGMNYCPNGVGGSYSSDGIEVQ